MGKKVFEYDNPKPFKKEVAKQRGKKEDENQILKYLAEATGTDPDGVGMLLEKLVKSDANYESLDHFLKEVRILVKDWGGQKLFYDKEQKFGDDEGERRSSIKGQEGDVIRLYSERKGDQVRWLYLWAMRNGILVEGSAAYEADNLRSRSMKGHFADRAHTLKYARQNARPKKGETKAKPRETQPEASKDWKGSAGVGGSGGISAGGEKKVPAGSGPAVTREGDSEDDWEKKADAPAKKASGGGGPAVTRDSDSEDDWEKKADAPAKKASGGSGPAVTRDSDSEGDGPEVPSSAGVGGSGGISPTGIERAEQKGSRESELIMPPAALVCFVLKKSASDELRATFYGRRERNQREQDKKKASTVQASVVVKGSEGYYVGDWGFKSEKTFVSVSIGDANATWEFLKERIEKIVLTSHL